MIGKLYGLTPAERKVAEILSRGLTPTQAAGSLGVSDNTIKTHVARIYSKLDVSKQAELVALLARLKPPLQG